MPVFTLDQLRALANNYLTLQGRLDAIATDYANPHLAGASGAAVLLSGLPLTVVPLRLPFTLP
jgi:hypothetical protein